MISLAAPSAAQAQSDRVWLDIDAARLFPAQSERVTTLVLPPPSGAQPLSPFGGATPTQAVRYAQPPGAGGIDVGGGMMIALRIGAAVHFAAATSHATADASVALAFPSGAGIGPLSASAPADSLDRRDRVVDVSAVYRIPLSESIELRISGGPTYARVTNSMVGFVGFSARALAGTSPTVAITDLAYQEVTSSGWGFNAGADVSVFPARHVGVGGGIRFSRATVSAVDPLNSQTVDLRAGGTRIGGGLRLRF